MIVCTWNMQGGGGSESKWASSVQGLFSRFGASVVLLQECGSPPGVDMMQIAGTDWVGPGRPGSAVSCTMGLWGRDEKFVVHAEWGEGNNRCSLAIVSRQRPQCPLYLENPLNAAQRPLIGLKIGTRLFATVHCMSGSGNDGPRFLDAMPALGRACHARSWFVAGDFNRDPARYDRTADRGLWAGGFVTYPSSRSELDYGFGSFACPSGQIAQTGIQSDHVAIQFRLPD